MVSMVSVSMAIIYCLYLLRVLAHECSSYNMANEQSFESLNDESLNTSDLSSSRRRKGKGVSETVISGKARRWSDAKIDMARVCFLRLLGRFWSQVLYSFCPSFALISFIGN